MSRKIDLYYNNFFSMLRNSLMTLFDGISNEFLVTTSDKPIKFASLIYK
jgi:hypothetical protein